MTRVELYFALIVAAIWTAVRRYDGTVKIMGPVRRVKHAAQGRATRKGRDAMHWLGAGHRLEGMHESASTVVVRLRKEREKHARNRRVVMALLSA